MSDLPKQYDPKIHEPRAQALWEEKKIYRPLSAEERASSVFQNGSISSENREPQ